MVGPGGLDRHAHAIGGCGRQQAAALERAVHRRAGDDGILFVREGVVHLRRDGEAAARFDFIDRADPAHHEAGGRSPAKDACPPARVAWSNRRCRTHVPPESPAHQFAEPIFAVPGIRSPRYSQSMPSVKAVSSSCLMSGAGIAIKNAPVAMTAGVRAASRMMPAFGERRNAGGLRRNLKAGAVAGHRVRSGLAGEGKPRGRCLFGPSLYRSRHALDILAQRVAQI